MKISTILDHIDSGHMALPEFQRGYVWNRDQVRGLMDSIYRRHPVGSLLVWATESEDARYRGEGDLAPGVVKLLLDGQQRMTSLYGLIRGHAPQFFDGNARTFTGLRFNLESEEFSFYQPVKMKDDPLWVDVSELMKRGTDGLGAFVAQMSATPELVPRVGDYIGRLSAVLGIKEIDLHIEEVTGTDKSIDVVVDIFNRVNSGGTKLSKGDLALAKICAEWPDAREEMKAALKRWEDAGYQFNLDWLLRNVNTVITGEAKFLHLHDITAEKFKEGLKRTSKHVDTLLNLIAGRLGLDHDRVFFARYALPVMVNFLDRMGGRIEDERDQDRLLFWYLHTAMWGRFSGSTESYIDKDLKLIEDLDGALNRLIGELRLWHGGLRVRPDHFGGWNRGARFYPVLYLLTRVGEAKDWGSGLPLKSHMLGRMSALEVHHIFPKKVLYKHGYTKSQVNAVANYCFLTKDTNLQISADPPEAYFPKIEAKHPGALASQWVPMDEGLWKVENYLEFLEARKVLLAEAINGFLDELSHEEEPEQEVEVVGAVSTPSEMDAPQAVVPGGVETEEEEALLLECAAWVVGQGLPKGEYLYELVDQETGDPVAVLDLAWPGGLQQGYSQPVALLLNEGPETYAAANAHGFRYFTSKEAFKEYVVGEVI